MYEKFIVLLLLCFVVLGQSNDLVALTQSNVRACGKGFVPGEDEKYTVDVSGMGTQAVCINDTAGSSSNVFQAIRCTTNGDSPSGSIDFLVNRSQFGGGDMFCFLNESNSGSSLFGVQGLDGATLSLFCRLTTSESTTTVNVLVIRKNPQSLSYHPQGNKGNVTGVSGMLTVIAVFTGLKSEFDSLRSDDGVTCEQKSHPGVHNCGYGRGAREVTYVCSVTAQEDRPYRLYHRGTPYDVQLTVVAANTTAPPGLSPTALSIGQTVAIGVVVPILFITIGIVVLLVIIIVLVRKHSTRSRKATDDLLKTANDTNATMHGKQTLNGAEQGNGRLHSEDKPSVNGPQGNGRGDNRQASISSDKLGDQQKGEYESSKLLGNGTSPRTHQPSNDKQESSVSSQSTSSHPPEVMRALSNFDDAPKIRT
jgi:hypothetical protein